MKPRQGPKKQPQHRLGRCARRFLPKSGTNLQEKTSFIYDYPCCFREKNIVRKRYISTTRSKTTECVGIRMGKRFVWRKGGQSILYIDILEVFSNLEDFTSEKQFLEMGANSKFLGLRCGVKMPFLVLYGGDINSIYGWLVALVHIGN